MSIGNILNPSTSSFGGGIPVWKSVDTNGIWPGGGVIQNLPAAGTVIAAGHPVEINTANHTAKLCNVFKVHEAIDTSATTLKISVLPGLPRLKAGNYIMVPPAAATGTGTAITVGTVTQGTAYDSITIVANSLGALDAGSLLVEAAASGGSKAQYAVPNALTLVDIYVDANTTLATATGVHTGTVYATRCPLMSSGIKAALTTIKFDNSPA